MKKLILFIATIFLFNTIQAQWDILTDSTYLSSKSGKYYEHQLILTTDGKTITITQEVTDTVGILKVLRSDIEDLREQKANITSEITELRDYVKILVARKEKIQHRLDFKIKRQENIIKQYR